MKISRNKPEFSSELIHKMSPSQTTLIDLLTFNRAVILLAYLPDHPETACSGPVKYNATSLVVPFVMSLSICQNGQFVGDFAIVCKSSKFLSFEIRTTIFNNTMGV